MVVVFCGVLWCFVVWYGVRVGPLSVEYVACWRCVVAGGENAVVSRGRSAVVGRGVPIA
jgi:hypothetical protein